MLFPVPGGVNRQNKQVGWEFIFFYIIRNLCCLFVRALNHKSKKQTTKTTKKKQEIKRATRNMNKENTGDVNRSKFTVELFTHL